MSRDEQIERVYNRAYDLAYFIGPDGQAAGIRAGVHAVAEWAQKEALREVVEVAEKNRVIMMTRHRGYTVEDYSDPLVRIAILRALAEE